MVRIIEHIKEQHDIYLNNCFSQAKRRKNMNLSNLLLNRCVPRDKIPTTPRFGNFH